MTHKINIEVTPEELSIVQEALGMLFKRGVNSLSVTDHMVNLLPPGDTKDKLARDSKEMWKRTRTADALRVRLEPLAEEYKGYTEEKQESANAVA